MHIIVRIVTHPHLTLSVVLVVNELNGCQSHSECGGLWRCYGAEEGGSQPSS